MSGFTRDDYDSYAMSLKERLLCTGTAAIASYAVCYIFYRSHAICLLFSLLALAYPKLRLKAIVQKRKKRLNLQFRDMLYALSSSVSVGQPVERAFLSVKKDLELQYPDPEELINREVSLAVAKLEMNTPVEAVLADLAARSHLEDIKNFADAFIICKRSGGNLAEVIRNTSNIIGDKLDISQEIETALAEKKLESKILTAMPILIVLLLSATAGDYIRPVFETITGRLAMTLSVLLLLAANFITRRIFDINV